MPSIDVPPTVILFDIDGTLIDNGGAGRRAMERAFVEQAGDARGAGFSFAGMTDRGIVRRALEHARDEPVTERAIDALLHRYLEVLEEELERAADYRVLPGVVALLERLERCASVALGLGTGNIASGAQLKLGPAGLNRFFPFGGFGSDAEDRVAVIAKGIERGTARLGGAGCRKVVVGDTPLDVAAARANNAVCLAVATGWTPRRELEQADLLVEDLTDPAAERFLLGE